MDRTEILKGAAGAIVRLSAALKSFDRSDQIYRNGKPIRGGLYVFTHADKYRSILKLT